MFLSEPEFHAVTKKFSLTWKSIVDEEITPGKEYLISDKQFEHNGKTINILEKLKGKYRRVATRLAHKGKPYINFDVSAHLRKSKQKANLLHRARLISFMGLMPDKPHARHGKLGQHNNDLNNLSWGTHEENMDDVKIHGTHKGENNASSKITNEQAVVVYTLAHLDLITANIIATLPISKGSVSSIKSKRKWGHVVSSEIEHLVSQCKLVLAEKNEQSIEKLRLKLESEHAKKIDEIKREMKSKIKNTLADI